MIEIRRPHYEPLELAAALAWRADADWLIEEKLDGCWHAGPLPGRAGSLAVGERLRGGAIVWFDLLFLDGRDLRRLPLARRLELLDETACAAGLRRPARGADGEFVRRLLERGGEGAVFKPMRAPWGAPWLKAKRFVTLDARVLALERDGSVAVVEVDGLESGRVSLGRWSGRLQPGQWIEVTAYGLTVRHKLREPRMTRPRPDLPHVPLTANL